MIGQQFGNYRVLSLLGEGGMGAVYLAEHPGIGRRVAVKVLHKQFSGDEQLLGRLLNEARAANAIRHPNIIEILDSGMREDGVPYLVMELLEGESLGQRIRRAGALPLADVLAFVLQTASALGAAHKKGIVHRDLKPDNLFIVPISSGDESGRVETDGPTEKMKVLDFGIAKLQMPQPGDSVKTRTGTLMGTPVYMSPEQCRGTKMVDHRSDVYSLGIIFYEMLVGHPPFVSEGFGELVNMHLNVPPPSARVARPEVSEQLDGIITKMLAKNPEDRYPDMASLTSAIRLAAGPPFSVHRSSPDLSHTPPPVANARPVPTGDGRPAQPQVTTFRTGVGEVTVPPTIQTGGGRGKMIAGVVALAVLGGGAYFFLGGGSKVEPAPVAVAAPAPKPEAPAPVVAPAPKPAAPVAPKTVTVHLATDPQGAQIFDVAGGASLGTTPLALTRPRGAALKVRVAKDGYLDSTRDVSLDEDSALEFALEHKPTPAPKPHAHKVSRERDHGADDGPAKL
ncbi:MAG TPA: protein kinase [Polyangia bacterium]|jgi:serine/threonine-protein kinase|nr:protein kinase [Polyangia bacterium]